MKFIVKVHDKYNNVAIEETRPTIERAIMCANFFHRRGWSWCSVEDENMNLIYWINHDKTSMYNTEYIKQRTHA